jgi:hypothetical protein
MRRSRSIPVVVLIVVLSLTGWKIGTEFLAERARFQRTEASIQRMGASLRSIDSPERAWLAIELWGIWLATSHYGYPTRASYLRCLAETRETAISNVVVGLEDYSGERYGTDLDAWRRWSVAQAEQAAANKTVERTGAPRFGFD